jgi:serine/threonine protein kinase
MGTLLQDRFLIEQQLAQGGMGAVYLATDQKFGSRVAIKERIYEHAELAEAFEREARILNTLHHPILPHVSDYFSEPGGHFLVMEYIEGEDLSELLKRGEAFEVEDVVRWAIELLDGLDHLHSQDPPIIHRDIKPGNLKLTSRGNIVLLDFGLAKETSGNTQGVRSVFGYSRRYSPLEQIEGAGTDVRSDIFSLGATLYHLITGHAPADVLSRASAIVVGRQDPLEPANEVNTKVSTAIADFIGRAMALDPEKRFASAADMRSALESAVNDAADAAAAFANVNRTDEEITLVSAANVADDRDDTTPMAVNEAPSRREHVAPPRRTYGGAAAFTQRYAFRMAIVLLALLAIGYAGLRASRSSSGPTDEIVEQPAASATPAATPEPDQPEDLAATAQSDQPETVRIEDNSIDPDQEMAASARPSEKTEKQPALIRDKKQAAETAKRRTAARDIEDMDEPILPIRRQRRNQAYEVRPRTVRRGERIYEPPVSDIEMIFTGISPRQRRKMRRYYPY